MKQFFTKQKLKVLKIFFYLKIDYKKVYIFQFKLKTLQFSLYASIKRCMIWLKNGII